MSRCCWWCGRSWAGSQLVASGALPAPSAILVRFWADRGDYPAHVMATLQASFLGFLIGNAIAIVAGIAFMLWPAMLRLFRGVNIAIFALPPIAISPVLVLTFSGMTPRVILAALGCYFATMTATVLGISQADARSLDVVRAYGGGRLAQMRLVQLRSALPSILGGLRIAAPAAVLGAILAEFGGGGRHGLGTYLLGSLGRADPPRLWGIGLMATLIAGLAYAVFAMAGARVTGASRAVTVPTAAPGAAAETSVLPARLLMALPRRPCRFSSGGCCCVVLRVPEMIAKTPAGIVDYLFLGKQRRAGAAAPARSLARDPADHAGGPFRRTCLRLCAGHTVRPLPGTCAQPDAGGARHADHAARGLDAAAGADAGARNVAHLVGDDLGDVLSRLRHPGAGPLPGAARRARRAPRLWRIEAAGAVSRLAARLASLSFRRHAAGGAARAAGRDDRRMAGNRAWASATC